MRIEDPQAFQEALEKQFSGMPGTAVVGINLLDRKGPALLSIPDEEPIQVVDGEFFTTFGLGLDGEIFFTHESLEYEGSNGEKVYEVSHFKSGVSMRLQDDFFLTRESARQGTVLNLSRLPADWRVNRINELKPICGGSDAQG